jgi:hypothetical protein
MSQPHDRICDVTNHGEVVGLDEKVSNFIMSGSGGGLGSSSAKMPSYDNAGMPCIK